MSNVSIFTQVDRAREEFLEKTRRGRQEADTRRRRRLREQEERLRGQRAQVATRKRSHKAQSGQAEQHRRELQQLEKEQQQVAREQHQAQEDARWTLERRAMSWRDLGLVTRLAEAQGYRLVPVAPLRDGAGQQAVTAQLVRQGRPPVGLIRHQNGIEVVSHDAELVKSFVQPIAQGYALEKALTGLRERGFQAEVVRLPGGEFRVQATRQQPRHIQIHQ